MCWMCWHVVARLCLQDHMMLSAMDKNPFVVMGSEYKDIDFERVWRTELEKQSRRKKAQSTGGLPTLPETRCFSLFIHFLGTPVSLQHPAWLKSRSYPAQGAVHAGHLINGQPSAHCVTVLLMPHRLVPQCACGGVCGQHQGCSST